MSDEQQSQPEPTIDPHHQRADMQMLSMAIRKGWDIPEKVLVAFPAEIVRIVANPKIPTRDRLRAMELMLKMHAQNEMRCQVPNLVQETKVSVEVKEAPKQELTAEEILARDVQAMDASVLPPSVVYRQATKPNGSNGNGNGNGNGHH